MPGSCPPPALATTLIPFAAISLRWPLMSVSTNFLAYPSAGFRVFAWVRIDMVTSAR